MTEFIILSKDELMTLCANMPVICYLRRKGKYVLCSEEYYAEQKESRSEIPNTCGDAISRKHLLEEIAMLKKSPWFNENTYGSKVIRKEAVEIVEDVCIKREPSVTPQQRTGRWIEKEEEGEAEPFIIWECNECHRYQRKQTAFCPNCGAKMEVEE